MKKMDYQQLFSKALEQAVYWQNRCCDYAEIVELFCIDAGEATWQQDGTTDSAKTMTASSGHGSQVGLMRGMYLGDI